MKRANLTKVPGRVRNQLWLAIPAACLALVEPAAAGPYVDWSRPSVAHAGEIVHVQAGAGVRMYALLPLYLVKANDAPPLRPCTLRSGGAASCPETSVGPPRGGKYHRIATLNVRHSNTVRVSFRVPELAPGPYVYVLYCGPCWRGARGSLIAFDYSTAPVLTVVR